MPVLLFTSLDEHFPNHQPLERAQFFDSLASLSRSRVVNILPLATHPASFGIVIASPASSMFRQTLSDSKLPVRLVECILMAQKLDYIVDFFFVPVVIDRENTDRCLNRPIVTVNVRFAL